MPLHTLRADIDYGLAEAKTTYGVIGVKCWIFKGDVADKELRKGALSAARRRGAAEVADAAAQEGQVPQAAEGPDARQGVSRQQRSRSATSACRRSTAARVTARQIEAARIAMTRHVKRGGKVWIRIFPDKPITKKPAETRMGKGKGNPEEWVAVVKPRPDPLRDGRRAARGGAGGAAARGAQAADADALREPRGDVMKARETPGADARASSTVKSRELRGELFNARVKRATGQLENTAKLEQLRRDIARVETVLREKRGGDDVNEPRHAANTGRGWS